MNILFLSISALPYIGEHSITLDLIHEFQRNGHKVYIVCAIEEKGSMETSLSEEAGCTVLRVKIGNNKNAGIIEKGLTMVMLPVRYISAIKKYLSGEQFDLILYPTPPITQTKTVKYLKKRDNASGYLLLKDIFPQNALDIDMMSKNGIKGILYRYFRRLEKELYAVSDYIGCMSQANVDYVLKHNPEVDPDKVEICPNSIEIPDRMPFADFKIEMRQKYELPIEKKVFVYGGNLGKPQGIPFLIECLKALLESEDAYFLIVGGGTEFEKLEAFVSRSEQKNVKLMRRIQKEDYDRLIAACDVGLIFLDHRFTIPNFPSRLLSYMQAGLPVLACTDPHTDIGKIITDNGFGWWCESNDIEKFVETVTMAISECDNEEMKKQELAYLMDNYSVKRSYEIVMKHYK